MSGPLTSVAMTAAAVRGGKASALEVARAALTRAEALNPKLNAFTQILHEEALAAAKRVDDRIARGEAAGPLAGVPIALKDNICTRAGRTTCASRMLEHYRSPFDATVVTRLQAAGAVVIGKTNCDEFAMGGSGEHSCFGATRNPWALDRVPGGSSSGSAAAVAAGIVPAALGSDTGGSIRQPASFCGITGLKPTYGRVSRYGLVAFASSLDQIGPLTRNAEDAALILGVISGHDPQDSTSAPVPTEDFAARLNEPVDGLVLGVPRQVAGSANHGAVNAALEAAADTWRTLGAQVVEVDLPQIDAGIAAYYIIAPAEASSNLARFDGIRYGRRAKTLPGEGLEDLYARSRAEGFGPEVRRRIMLGTHVLSSGYYDAYYVTAQKVRRLIKQDYDRAFAAGCHAVLMPASPGPAFKIGEKINDPLALYLEDLYTVGVNLAGLPGIVIPAGMAVEIEAGEPVSLPVGVQLVGPPLAEATLLRIARQFELATVWHSRAASIA